MNDSVIFCPNCKTEIKLTESLAAPLLEAERQEFEKKLEVERAKLAEAATKTARKEEEVFQREATLQEEKNKLLKDKESIDEKIAQKMETERAGIAAEEAKKIRQTLDLDIKKKDRALADLQVALDERNVKLTEAQNAQAELIRMKRALDDEKREMQLSIDKQVEEQLSNVRAEERRALKLELQSERAKIEEAASKKAQFDLGQKDKALAEIQEVLKDQDAKLEAAQNAQAELIRMKRALDDEKRAMSLAIETQVQDKLLSVRNEAQQEVKLELQLKVKEKELTITAMQEQIEKLKERSEQGSEQIQGEALEIILEELLREKFPSDEIEPVAKGVHGGDILHHVKNDAGQRCGTILWESKRTKAWSDGWLSKLRDDQRQAEAEVALIVSKTLPKNVKNFELIDGVWVSDFQCLVPLAAMIRQSLIDLTAARRMSEGQNSKMASVYQYLTGPQFRNHMTAIIEKFNDMKEDLATEQNAMQKLWKKRNKQIEGVLGATAGMYGDLQGIAGRTLQEIEGLDFKMLPEPQ